MLRVGDVDEVPAAPNVAEVLDADALPRALRSAEDEAGIPVLPGLLDSPARQLRKCVVRLLIPVANDIADVGARKRSHEPGFSGLTFQPRQRLKSSAMVDSRLKSRSA